MGFLYHVECMECGIELATTAEMDSDEDITVKVSPCEYCLKDERDEGVAEGEESCKD